MGAAYVLAGMIGGLCGFGLCLLSGASLWMALGMYVVAGVSLVLLAAAISVLRYREPALPLSRLQGFSTIKSHATDSASRLSSSVRRNDHVLLPGDGTSPSSLVPLTVKPGTRAIPVKV